MKLHRTVKPVMLARRKAICVVRWLRLSAVQEFSG